MPTNNQPTNNSNYIERLIQIKLNKISSFLKLALKDFEKDGDISSLLLTLRQVTKAKNGFAEVFSGVGLTREALYRKPYSFNLQSHS